MKFIELNIASAESKKDSPFFSEDAHTCLLNTDLIRNIHVRGCKMDENECLCVSIDTDEQTFKELCTCGYDDTLFVVEDYESLVNRLSNNVVNAPKINNRLLNKIFKQKITIFAE
jgi:hypothetical protein